MLYRIVGTLIRVATREFFREIHVVGAPTIPTGPLIVASTHPNQAVDPFLIGALYRRELWFLAKSTLFRNPILRKIFESLHMVPVYRRQDNEDMGKNDATFEAVAEVLRRGDAVAIFPEGTSSEIRTLLPLKTGAARIALLAESRSLFSLGVKIQPVSITYSAPRLFGSTVTLTLGHPLEATSYKSEYERDPASAVRGLTEHLTESLRLITVEVRDTAHQKLVEKIAVLFRNRGQDDRLLFQRIATAVEKALPHAGTEVAQLESRIDDYLQVAELFQIDSTDHALLSEYHSLSTKLLTAPVVLGVLFNYIPYRLVGIVAQKLVSDPQNLASVKIGVGVSLFLLWYMCLGIIGYATGGPLLSLFAVALAIGSAMIANRYFTRCWLLILSTLWPGRSNPVALVTAMRTSLQDELLALEAATRQRD